MNLKVNTAKFYGNTSLHYEKDDNINCWSFSTFDVGYLIFNQLFQNYNIEFSGGVIALRGVEWVLLF